MAILATVIENLLNKLGIDNTNEAYLKLVQDKALTIEVPDDIATPLNSLLTINEAKKNIEIKNHYYANALDPLDGKVKEWAKEYGVEEADLTDILSDKSTFNRVEKTLRKIADLKSKASGADSKGDKDKYIAQINELSSQLSTIATAKQAELDTLRNGYEDQLKNQEIDFFLGSQPLPGQFAADVERKMANMFIEQELVKHKATLIRKDGKIKLVSKDDNNFPIFDNGKELDFPTLTNAALAGNKFLKVKDANPPPPKAPNGATPPNENPRLNEIHAQIDEDLNFFKSK